MKIGRNQPCPCGSGKKYKWCHGDPSRPSAAMAKRHFERVEAEQMIRREQQGLGRPIVALEANGHRIVAVRNRVIWSKNWKTFPDFLSAYLKITLGDHWWAAELEKRPRERHPIVHWRQSYGRQQAKIFKNQGEIYTMQVTGAAAGWIGLAYSVYLLDHNVDLQDRLVERLRNPRDFQGAYYELLIANTLIRAGFDLALEDETSRAEKHCEFAAVSQHTGRRYWVEAKMRGVQGVLGRTVADGTNDPNPLNQLIKHLSRALKKPASDERMIFVDLNADMGESISPENPPDWFEPAMRKLERHEASGQAKDKRAYVFVTNFPFHRDLDGVAQVFVGPFGFNISDFNRPGSFRLSETWRQRKSHEDAFRIVESVGKLLQFPSTFDGSLPSASFGQQSDRVKIGGAYDFDDGKGGRQRGTVTSAIVMEAEKSAGIIVQLSDGSSHVFTIPMSGAELADYRRHPDAYFGKIIPVGGTAQTPFELFEFFMDSYGDASRGQLLSIARRASNYAQLETLDNEDLRLAVCEMLTNSIAVKNPFFRNLKATTDASTAGSERR